MIYKILLINPPSEGEDINANYGCYPPIGILQLATRVKNDFGDKIKVKIIDGAITPEKDILDTIRSFQPDLVGLSILSLTYKKALEFARESKKNGAKIVLGNDNASFFPMAVLIKRNFIDYLIINDVGEIPFSQLIGYELNERRIEEVDSLFYKNEEGHIFFNSKSMFDLCDVNTIPDLDFIEKDLDTYSKNYMQKYGHLHENIIRPTIINNSRGCKNYKRKCSFCNILDLRINLGKPELFWKIIKLYNEKYGINLFYEAFDSFFSSQLYVDQLLDSMPQEIKDKIEKNKIELIVYADATDLSNNDNVKKLKKLGVKRIIMGLESGTDYSLAKLKNPNSTLQKNIMALKNLKITDIKVHAGYVIGAKGETKESTDKTIEEIKNLVRTFHSTGKPLFSAIEVSRLIPLPNSAVWEKLLLNHPELKDNDMIDINNVTMLWFNEFTKVDHDYVIKKINEIDDFLIRNNIITGKHS